MHVLGREGHVEMDRVVDHERGDVYELKREVKVSSGGEWDG